MTTIIGFSDRNQPDAEHVYRDFREHVVNTHYRFCGSYEFGGDKFEIEIWASNIDEARQHLAAVSSGQIDGQIMGSVDT